MLLRLQLSLHQRVLETASPSRSHTQSLLPLPSQLVMLQEARVEREREDVEERPRLDAQPRRPPRSLIPRWSTTLSPLPRPMLLQLPPLQLPLPVVTPQWRMRFCKSLIFFHKVMSTSIRLYESTSSAPPFSTLDHFTVLACSQSAFRNICSVPGTDKITKTQTTASSLFHRTA